MSKSLSFENGDFQFKIERFDSGAFACLEIVAKPVYGDDRLRYAFLSVVDARQLRDFLIEEIGDE